MLTRQQKEEQVEVLRSKLSKASSLVAVDFRGMTVDDANALRSKLREAGGKTIEYRVAKNTLLRIATQGTPLAPIEKHLAGPTAVAISYDEPGAMAKVLVAFAKDHEKFKIKGGVVEGAVADLAMISAVAALPGKRELRGMLAGTLQSPLRNLASSLQSLLGNLRNALEQRQQKLDASN
jgi:large subunit ribosomal protein L10